MENHYIVKLEDGVWLAPWEGDPGRTLKKENATKFYIRENAKKALNDAMKHRTFHNPEIVPCWVN